MYNSSNVFFGVDYHFNLYKNEYLIRKHLNEVEISKPFTASN